ncbi:MAG TPA: hypothetical protein VN253_07740 [Kofleriaceae bacterium]|nr:hypothetical protein [Kofleriaceae bacterium]
MRRLVLAAIVALGLALGLGLGAGSVVSPAAAEPQMTERKVEILEHRPSGFWTSNRPAQGGAYRWRLLGIGVVLASATGFLMWKLTRKANAERMARDK